MKRELLQLADTYIEQDNIIGWFASEKLDGSLGFWDGGISRGLPTEQVPYASILHPKTGKRKPKIKPVATGLWSRYGNPVMAPDWFLDQLPPFILIGELWAGRGKFQLSRSIVAGDTPDPRFDQVQFRVYSAPSIEDVFQPGVIKNSNMLCEITEETRDWVQLRASHDSHARTFHEELEFMKAHVNETDNLKVHEQHLVMDHDALNTFLEDVLGAGGEGLILRDPFSRWRPKRSKSILKWKPYLDAEAKIVGFVSGAEGRQGNVLGKIGALICETVGPKGKVRFELGTGMTMEEREFATEADYEWACDHPETPTATSQGKHFKIGQTVTFKFREWTDDGIPKEGRYWRDYTAL